MIPIFQLAHDIFVHQSRIWHLNSVLWLTGHPCVVDPAYFPDEIELIRSYMQGKPRANLVFTHGDFDHVVGGPFFPGSPLVTHQNYRLTDIPGQLRELHETDETFGVDRGDFHYPEPSITFENKLEIYVGKRVLLLQYTPGHTPDSLIVADAERQVLATGDMLSDIEFPFVYHNSGEYLDSLRRVAKLKDELDIQSLIPGHGLIARGREEIRERIDADIDYLEELIGRVTDLWNAGVWDKEIMAVMAEMRYKGERITMLMKAHMDNVEKILNELEE